MDWMKESLQDFGDRMKNILLFSPLLALSQKTKYPYDLPELAMAVLLYVLEKMVRREKSCTYDNIAYYLQGLIHQLYSQLLSFQDALDLTYYLVREGLMNQGKPHQVEYFDLEKGEKRIHKFYLLELESYEVQEQIVHLRLSNDGLEMLFKTKEIYGELQVTIAQLYLRQQIQKGVFEGALRAVEELALAVHSEKIMLRQLEERIIRDVLQVAREQELEKQHQRIDEQLQREHEVFHELAQLIEETLAEYQGKNLNKKEEKAVQTIMQIRRLLYDVIHEHESLFKEKLRIHQVMIKSVESSILSSFTTKVNFETEFLYPVVQRDLSINPLKKLLDPLLPLREIAFFHPGRIFLEQPLKRQEEEGNPEEEIWVIEEELARQEEERERARQEERLHYLEFYFLLILQPLVAKKEVYVGQLLEELAQIDPPKYQEITQRMDFFGFLVQLHQLGEIPLKTRAELDLFVLDDLPGVLLGSMAKTKSCTQVMVLFPRTI
jgi:hypothetical protein